MSLSNIVDWLKQCPQMEDLFVISAEGQDGTNLITPFASSDRASIVDRLDVTNAYNADIIPYNSVYEEYQVDCFRHAYPNENADAIMQYDDVKEACKWIEEQNLTKNFPDFGENVIRVEPKPFLPTVRWKDIDANLVGYCFTLRITYVNDMPRQVIEYAGG